MARSQAAPPWRRAFLRELARSGNVAAAAEKAGIDRSSAYQVRRRNAAFAASWERAVGAFGDTLAASGGGVGAGEIPADVGGGGPDPRPCSESRASEHPLPQGGGVTGAPPPRRDKLRLRDDECVRASKAGRPCVVRAGPGRWSVGAERAFLAELTASANVRAAARAAGVSAVAAYNRRKLWPAFAAAWREAIDEGYARIETLLVGAATAALDPGPEGGDERALRQAQGERLFEPPEMTVEQAMKLWLHHAGVEGGRAPRQRWRRREPDIEEVRAEILRRVAAVERARQGKAGKGYRGAEVFRAAGAPPPSPSSRGWSPSPGGGG